MSEEVLDQWEIALKNKRHELEDCQKQQHIKSCTNCEKILDCALRDSYVQAVYDSMSKNQGGGFEF